MLYAAAARAVAARARRLLSVVPSRAPAPSPPPPPSPLASAPAASRARASHTVLRAAFAGAPGGPLAGWAEAFHRRPGPHARLLDGALLEALRTPGALAGPASLAGAAFFAEVFRRLAPDADSAAAAMDSFLGAAAAAGALARGGLDARGGAGGAAGEVLDTLLRAMYLADTPALDAYLARGVGERAWAAAGPAPFEPGEGPWGGGGGGAGGGAASASASADAADAADVDAAARWTPEDDAAAAASLLPPPGERHRAHVLAWPLPLANLAAFEAHVAAARFPLYGATRFWFAHTHALRKLSLARAPAARGRVPLLSPGLAGELTKALADAAWAYFYATGDAPGAVGRVLDIGTPFAAFLDEFGPEWVTRAEEPAFAAPPAALDDAPLERARFESARYAVHGLLTAARRQAAVGEAFLARLGAVADAVALAGPAELGAPDGLTAHGRAQLRLMRALRPALTGLAVSAARDGVGSGAYPLGYDAALEWDARGGGDEADAAALAARVEAARARAAAEIEGAGGGRRLAAAAAGEGGGLPAAAAGGDNSAAGAPPPGRADEPAATGGAATVPAAGHVERRRTGEGLATRSERIRRGSV